MRAYLEPRQKTFVEMAQAMLSNATIARRCRVSPRTIRRELARARRLGHDVPLNAERMAHEEARAGVRLHPLSGAEIERLDRAARARGVSVVDVLNRAVRELCAGASFPVLLDNVLDDDVRS